ncbi:cation:dicarboxylase symporter family transporter [candidate division GN15 bacterium]|nr:cation:dicarboxylase symporter family transporter [candidate division GN15 bacterium]
MNDQPSQHLSYWILLGIIVGALFGWFLPGAILALDFVGDLFLNALKIIVFPLILTTVIVGITALGDYRKLGRTAMKTIGFFVATSGIAVAIGLILAFVFGPGRGMRVSESPIPLEVMPEKLRSFGDFLSSLIPRNLIEAADGGSYIGLVVVSIVVGIVLTTRGVRGRTILSFFKDLRELLLKMLTWLMVVAPIGLGVLVGTVVANHRGTLDELVTVYGTFSLVILVGLAIQFIIVLPIFLKMFGQRSPVQYYSEMLPAFWTAFGTASSSATLPVTYDNVVRRNEVDERAGSFVLPLSMSLNMNGSGLFLAVGAVFVAQAAGVGLSFIQIAQLLIGALIVSMALGGVPNAALWGLIAVCSIAGYPREAMAAFSTLLVVDWLLDRLRTVVNVAGDGVAAAVIGETFEFKTVGRQGARAASARTRSERRPRSDRKDRSGDDRGGRRGGRSGDRSSDRRSTRKAATETGKGEERSDNRRGRRSSERPERQSSRRGDRRQQRPERGGREGGRRDDKATPTSGDDKRREDKRQRSDEPARTESRPEPKPAEPKRAERGPEPEPQSPSPATKAERIEEAPAPKPERSHKPEKSEERQGPQQQEKPEKPEPKADEKPSERPEPKPEPAASEDKRPESAERKLPEAKPSPEPQDGGDEAEEQEKQEKPAMTFGRSLHRRGKAAAEAKKSESEPGPVSASEDDDEKAPEPESSYSNENISFGRGKRSRVR